jgi:hypothetical protein
MKVGDRVITTNGDIPFYTIGAEGVIVEIIDGMADVDFYGCNTDLYMVQETEDEEYHSWFVPLEDLKLI